MTIENGFLKDILILEENPNKFDVFNLGEQYEYFEKKINQTSNKSIMAIVGPYGSGKSTMLYNILNTSKGSANWVIFDAWSYPERKGLWDGLILKIAQEILGDSSSRKVQEVIDGTKPKSKITTGISAVATGASIATVGLDFTSILPGILERIGISIEDFQKLSNGGPIFRIEGFKELFRKILNQLGEKEIIVVLEDIDRAGKEGIFFLETLFQFLKFESSGDFNIKFIVPISKNSYVEDFESYMKCIDNFEFFNIKPDGVESYIQFTETYFNEDIFLEYKRIKPLVLISEFFYLFSRSHEISFRKLGLIIRSANARYIYLKNILPDNPINPYIVITLECMNFIDKGDGKDKIDYLSEFVKNRKLGAGALFGAMLFTSQYKDENWSLIRDNKVNESFSDQEINIRDMGGHIFEYYFKFLRDLPPISVLIPQRPTVIRSFPI